MGYRNKCIKSKSELRKTQTLVLATESQIDIWLELLFRSQRATVTEHHNAHVTRLPNIQILYFNIVLNKLQMLHN